MEVNKHMNKEFLDKLRLQLPIEAVTSKGKAKGFITGEEIELMGYKWQHIVIHLDNNFDWEFEIKNTWSDEKNWYVHGRLTLNIKKTQDDGIFDNYSYREQIGSAERKKTNDGYALKGAVDDCLSRCCAMFEIGMTAYLGQETRKPIGGNEQVKIMAYMEKHNLDVQQFRDKLLENGFDNVVALNELPDLSPENAESIWKFIVNSRGKAIMKPLEETFDYELCNADFGRVTGLVNRFGTDIVKEAINKFVNCKGVKPETTQKRQELMTSEPQAKWNYMTAICNTLYEASGKVNKEAKREVNKILGSGSAPVNQSPY